MSTDPLHPDGKCTCAGEGRCEWCARVEIEDDKPIAVVALGDHESHDGAGWYYWDEEYPDEGSVGAFETREAAEKHAREEGGYRIAAPEVVGERCDNCGGELLPDGTCPQCGVNGPVGGGSE